MSLKIYNTLTKKIEKFIPINDDQVNLYTCGPTVYDYAHIGNFRTFLFEDLLKRWLIHLGYNVRHIMNITDVDDKTIQKSIQEKKTLFFITEKYTKAFLRDLSWLNILPADHFPKATDYIDQMIKLIKDLIKKDMAYIDQGGSVYFRIESSPNYGLLANLKIENHQKSKRVLNDEYSKESINDFALWKAYKEDDGDIYWDSPWGKGRPGWHIECSAMSMAEFGCHFDLHCGGVDNIFPHHENEIAQSEGATGKKFVNYWMHSEFLLVDGGKMSKTIGNIFKIKELKELNFSAESIRYQLLSAHYRTKVNFSKLKKNENDRVVQRFLSFYNLLKINNADIIENTNLPDEYLKFKEKMNNDLDAPQALGVFFVWMKKTTNEIINKKISKEKMGSAWSFLIVFNSVFGFIDTEEPLIPDEISSILKIRDKARDEKNWPYADILRGELLSLGWIVEDTEQGQRVSKKK